ncbi:hypothetical protein FRB94_002808 [Tulasnella sp. JGI-2019a]|nr:hypothetical protein FRB93_004980 [Tulasnella sp. JGI-2019a]KAG9003891.1 hypothetical protein FRB94_002808 [Tulasnella sp. JGI-2019a]
MTEPRVSGLLSPGSSSDTENEKKDALRTSTTTARDSTATTDDSTVMSSSPPEDPSKPPPIRFKPWSEKRWNIIIYWLIIIFCNLALPCIIYYPIRTLTTMSLQNAIGAGSGSLGVSAMFEFPRRLYKLWRYRERYGGLNDDCRWHLDSFMFSYTFAMLVASVPLAVAPAFNPPLTKFFLMFSAMLIGSLGATMIPTLFKFRIPFWMSSDPPGTIIKPMIFYMVEDICAVDCSKGRQFRREWNARYNASPPFQRLMYRLTIFWIIGCFLYVGISAAVVFTTKVDFAFAFTLGLVYIWGVIWYAVTHTWVDYALSRERKWWAERASTKEARV